MNTILFTGAKGGTGKTLLASLLTTYLHRYERKRVALIGVDDQKIFTYTAAREKLSCRVIETNHHSIIHSLQEIEGTCDIAIIDTNWQNSANFLQLLHRADKVVIPFEYNELDFYKLMFAAGIFRRHHVAPGKICLIPNKDYQSKNLHIRNQLKKHLKEFTISPPIPVISSNTLFNLQKKNINLIRDSFLYILYKM